MDEQEESKVGGGKGENKGNCRNGVEKVKYCIVHPFLILALDVIKAPSPRHMCIVLLQTRTFTCGLTLAALNLFSQKRRHSSNPLRQVNAPLTNCQPWWNRILLSKQIERLNKEISRDRDFTEGDPEGSMRTRMLLVI